MKDEIKYYIPMTEKPISVIDTILKQDNPETDGMDYLDDLCLCFYNATLLLNGEKYDTVTLDFVNGTVAGESYRKDEDGAEDCIENDKFKMKITVEALPKT
jgi:hypothetical protein